jgi:O-antigen/teichoic acid export membrane protein
LSMFGSGRMSRFSIFRNTLALFVPQIVNPTVSFILVLVISRYLGVTGLGKYSLIFSFIGIFSSLANMGLSTLVVREVTRRPKEVHVFFLNAAAIGSLSSLAMIVAMNALIAGMGYESDVVRAGLIFSFSLLASTTISFIESVFRAEEKSHYIALTQVIENVVKVAACVCLLLTGHGIVTIFAAILCSRFFGLSLMSWFYVRVFGLPRGRFHPEIMRLLAREAPTFTSITIFATLHLNLNQIMLSKIQDMHAVGIFSAADRLLSICITMPVAFGSALLPSFTRKHLDGMEALRSLTSDALRYMYLWNLPIVLGTFLLSDQIINVIYGAKFDAAGSLLRVHILSLIPFSTVYLLAQVLMATDNQRVDLKINIAGATLVFLLNLVLIPHFGAMGAVVTTLITIVIFNQLQYWYIRSHLFTLSFLGLVWRPLAAALTMGVVTYSLSATSLFLNIGISAIAYFVLIVVFRAVSRNELLFLASAIVGRRRNELS